MSDYKDSGVDIRVANKAEALIGKAAKKTYNRLVVSGVGGFGGVYSLSRIRGMNEPLLVCTVDGVGTKVKVAAELGKWGSVGIDIVNHCSNDLLAMGAKPVFFLDYVASSKLNPKTVAEIVSGMAVACRELDCPLLGGETAEMPGVYASGEADVVGCMIGVVEKKNLLPKKSVRKGDVLVALESNGLHTNGYSLARQVLFEKAGYKVDDYVHDAGGYLGEVLLAPHKTYSKSVLALSKKVSVKAVAHITGGGLRENIPRILPRGLRAGIDYSSISVPGIFRLIQEKGSVPEDEMFRTFNMGVGLVLVVAENEAEKAIRLLNASGEHAWVLGRVMRA